MLACMPTCFNEGPGSLLLLKREFPQGDSYCASVNDIQYCFPLFLSYIAVEELSFCSLSLWLLCYLLLFGYVDYVVIVMDRSKKQPIDKSEKNYNPLLQI